MSLNYERYIASTEWAEKRNLRLAVDGNLKKPAADGPKYRALGNSMAVPCMWWLGKRIQEATQPPT